jgi:hypothetical protein
MRAHRFLFYRVVASRAGKIALDVCIPYPACAISDLIQHKIPLRLVGLIANDGSKPAGASRSAAEKGPNSQTAGAIRNY